MSGNGKEKYVFSMGVIPVQEYISQARRSRDLKWGSAFLSKAAALALNVLVNRLDAEILIPKIETLDKISSMPMDQLFAHAGYGVPNRASGWCWSSSRQHLNDVFQSLNDEIFREWENLADRFLSSKYKSEISEDALEAFEKVIDGVCRAAMTLESPVRAVWAVLKACNETNRDKCLKEDLKRINKYYNEVKLIRPIEPWQNGSCAPKCTMCGQREAMGDNRSFYHWRKWEKELKDMDWIKKEFWFDLNERLCPACALKRVASYKSSDSFPSTNEIACGQWLHSARQRSGWSGKVDEKFGKLQEAFKKHKMPDDFFLVFYPRSQEKLNRQIETPSLEPELKNKVAKFKKHLARLNNNKDSDSTQKGHPSDYLAVIAYDGDSMGKRVQESPDLISRFMNRFAETARKTIGSYLGKVFYIGGDEGLILCPIENAIGLSLHLRRDFGCVFAGVREPPTLSAASVIFDRERPLGGAIRQAHALLRKAKDAPKKNRLAVAVETASGSRLHFVAGWSHCWRWLLDIFNHLMDGSMSLSWTGEVEQFIRNLPEKAFISDTPKDAIVAEMQRITYRKLTGNFSGRKEKKEYLNELFVHFDADQWFKEYRNIGDLDIFANQFHLLRFLSRHSSHLFKGGR